MRRGRLLGISLLALLLGGAGGVAAWRARHAATTDAAVSAGHPGPSAAAGASPAGAATREATIEASLSAITDGDGAAARDRWDPAYLAELLGRDPAASLEWVRTWTAWVPYHGVLRGPTGVLLDRQGNSLDRALLLADLLGRAGHEVRLAHARLDAARARALLPSLRRARVTLARVPNPRTTPEWHADLRLAAQSYLQDSVRLVRLIEARLDSATRMLDTLDARTDAQTARLRELLPKSNGRGDPAAGEDSLVAALQDHWWVQRLENGRWIDLDVLGAAQGLTPEATVAPAALDPALYQRVVVRLITEHVSGGLLRARAAPAARDPAGRRDRAAGRARDHPGRLAAGPDRAGGRSRGRLSDGGARGAGVACHAGGRRPDGGGRDLPRRRRRRRQFRQPLRWPRPGHRQGGGRRSGRAERGLARIRDRRARSAVPGRPPAVCSTWSVPPPERPGVPSASRRMSGSASSAASPSPARPRSCRSAAASRRSTCSI